jgi:hypothetical protein
MFFSFGFLILLILLLPLVKLNLSDNMIVQFISIVYLVTVAFSWVILACLNGLTPSKVPMIGHDVSGVLGNVLFNYTLANTVPSWCNATVFYIQFNTSIAQEC